MSALTRARGMREAVGVASSKAFLVKGLRTNDLAGSAQDYCWTEMGMSDWTLPLNRLTGIFESVCQEFFMDLVTCVDDEIFL